MKTREIWQLAQIRHDAHGQGPETDDPRNWIEECAEELADAWNYVKYESERSALPEGSFWPVRNALQNAWRELRSLERKDARDRS